MAGSTVVMAARVEEAIERRVTLLAALRGVPRQEVLKRALERELEAAPERAEVERLALRYSIASEERREAIAGYAREHASAPTAGE